MIVALRVRLFELESVLCVDLTPVGSTVDCELLQGKSYVLFFASAFSSLANAAAAKSLQSCPTLCDPIPGILQARTLEWVAISFSNA